MMDMVYELRQHNTNDIFYIHYPMEYIWDSAKLKELTKYKLVVVNSCSEHWGDGAGSEAAMHCQQANLNFLVLSHNPDEHLIHPRIMYFPYWYHYSRKYFKKINPTLIRKYSLSCLNGSPRPHRIVNYLQLLNKPYIDQINISFFNKPDGEATRADDITLTESEATQWAQIRNQLPVEIISNDRELNLPALTNSYIHLVTETTIVPHIFTTEKTWKPIACGTLFLIFGNPGSIAHLRKLGVDVFDDIIDHNYYDNKLDWRDRLSCIHTLVDRLVAQDLEHIYKITQSRRLENQRKFFAGEFDTRYNQEVAEQIEKLKNVSIC